MRPLPLQVVKKSCYPRWNETFEFELAEPSEEKLCVEVWDWDLVGRNDFLGKVSPQTPSLLPGVLPGRTPEPLLPSPPRWWSASRGWRRPGRRTAGSGCGQTSPSRGRTSESRHGGAGGGRGGPSSHGGVGEGVIPGKHHPFGGAAPGNALVWDGEQVQGSPTCLPRLSQAVGPPPAW